MKLRSIYEAYDKTLGNSIAQKYHQEPAQIKAWVQVIDPDYAYAPWILKQLKENTPTNQLQDELKELITKFQNATEHSPDTLISTDINKYSLDSLRSALDTYIIKGEFEPESLDGVSKLRDFNVTRGFGATAGVETRIRAYLIINPRSLVTLSKGKGWCVKNKDTAMDYMRESPVIMIFRNNEATALGDVNGPELKNSQNKDEKRTEVQQLMIELKEDKNIIQLISENPVWAVEYAIGVIKGRWPEVEHTIIRDQELAIKYASQAIKGRWPEAEPTIIFDPEKAVQYARDVIKGRWPEAEDEIIKSVFQSYYYARDVIKGRWPEAEGKISNYPQATVSTHMAIKYARDVIKGRWPEAEEAIINSPYFVRSGSAIEYARDVIKGRWPEAEDKISKNPQLAYNYAKDVIKGRWPEAEPVIMTNKHHAREYAREVLKRPWPEAGIV